MSRWTRRARLVLAISAALAITACGESLDSDNRNVAPAETGKEGWPEKIVYGMTPTDEATDMARRYDPLEKYFNKCLDHPFELFVGTDYNTMIEAMRTGNAHIARFGPFAYILAHERAGAEALAVALEGGDSPIYRSLIITRKSYGFDDLADLEGKKFAFVDPTSASGHLFPRALIANEMGISSDEVDDWFSDVVYAGNHEASLLSVLNGDTDAGALASSATALVYENGTWKLRPDSEFADHENADDFMVLAESEDIPNTVDAVQKDLPDSLKKALLACFEGVAEAPSLADFREEMGGGEGYGFAAAKDSDYDPVRKTAKALGMSPEELLEQ
ncbi:MAG TPA: phosphate/phosphite/phosphonate ABC transporter substrate-binding protein [Actinopolymorphaceae bacterium]